VGEVETRDCIEVKVLSGISGASGGRPKVEDPVGGRNGPWLSGFSN